MPRKLPVPSVTRTRQLVRDSLRLGFTQDMTPGVSAREYFCTLDQQERRRQGERTVSHRVRLEYWAAQPPTRDEIVRRFHQHFTDECDRTER